MDTIDRSGPFRVKQWTLSGAQTVSFEFECARFGVFREDVVFPAHVNLDPKADKALEGLMDLLAGFMGVSAYKCNAAEQVIFDVGLHESGQKAAKALYTKGLGEFFARNNLAYPPDTQFVFSNTPEVKAHNTRSLDEQKPVLAFGGGKDSHVAQDMLIRQGKAPELVSVVLSDKVKTRLASMSAEPISFIERTLDARLIELNKTGKVLNGHIPITAINSLILTIYAHLTGRAQVVFANEAGASVPTLEYLGNPVNHQYSKSYAFEGLLRHALADILGDAPDYFSLLRSVSELWIAQYIAQKAQEIWPIMASCNRNFVFAGPNALAPEIRWCGRCAKCVYIALILAPFLGPDAFNTIFETDILNQDANLDMARDLIGLGTAKPWECVGDINDTFACLHIAAHGELWGQATIPQGLKELMDDHQPIAQSRAHFQSALTSRGPHFVPDALATSFNA